MAEQETGSRRLTLPEAAAYLDMPEAVVRSLAAAGYITEAVASPVPEFLVVDLRAFIARNADNGAGNLLDALDAEPADPAALLAALDGKAEDMARRAYGIFSSVFPETAGWTLQEQARFIEQAKARFEAILAVTGQGAEVDEALIGDLEGVGAGAAWAGSPLPELLVTLRISRDLVVQTAVELAEERGRHWGLALSLLLTRVLPAIDRLTDSLAQGYWNATLARQEEDAARYRDVVEHSSDGIYEIDLAGRIIFANPTLGMILGRTDGGLDDVLLADVLVSSEPWTATSGGTVELTIVRPDGVRRVLHVVSIARQREGEVTGFQGVVRDVTAARDLEAEKNEFLALITFDLRQPLTTVLGLGATIESHAEELDIERIKRIGRSIRRHAERISRLADDLYDLSRLEARSLLLTPRAVALSEVIDDALASVAEPAAVAVRVPDDVMVMVDPRRLEQVVGNLVDNALQHGAPPVEIELAGLGAATVDLAVIDHGPGVPAGSEAGLFARVTSLRSGARDRSRGTGLGLPLVDGLVKAMGGRVWYEPAPGGGACFRFTLPRARARTGT